MKAFITALNDERIRTLSTNGVSLRFRQIDCFMAAMQCSSLTELDMSHAGLGDSGMLALSSALHRNRTLQKLFLQNNGIANTGMMALMNSMAQGSTATDLRSLRLDCNRISDQGAAVATAALGGNQTLTELTLRQNLIGDDGAAAICRLLGCNWTLAHLDVRQNNFTQFGLDSLIDLWERGQHRCRLRLDEVDGIEHRVVDDSSSAALPTVATATLASSDFRPAPPCHADGHGSEVWRGEAVSRTATAGTLPHSLSLPAPIDALRSVRPLDSRQRSPASSPPSSDSAQPSFEDAVSHNYIDSAQPSFEDAVADFDELSVAAEAFALSELVQADVVPQAVPLDFDAVSDIVDSVSDILEVAIDRRLGHRCGC